MGRGHSASSQPLGAAPQRGSVPAEPPCLAELERIQIQEAAKKKPGEALGWAQSRRQGGCPVPLRPEAPAGVLGGGLA